LIQPLRPRLTGGQHTAHDAHDNNNKKNISLMVLFGHQQKHLTCLTVF